ncbi:MAG: exonuclease domain-containing protein [Candidatus Andersenbacteria bacterium]
MGLVFLDTETTGGEPGKDRLCQICYKLGDTVVDELFKPPLPISIKAMSITHITNKMVDDKPPFVGSSTHDELFKLLQEHILVAHNAPFDIAALEVEDITVPQFICTLRVARHLDDSEQIPEYNLQFLRYYFELEIEGVRPHDAKGDVLVLEAIFNELFSIAKEKSQDKSDQDIINEFMEISTKPSLVRRFRFGKYKGQRIEDVVQTNPGYLEWLLGEKEAQAATISGYNHDAELIYSLKHYLGRTA